MATTASARSRRPHVTPSLVKSETFLFALLVVGLAIYVPYMFRTGRADTLHLSNSTKPLILTADTSGNIQIPLAAPPVAGAVGAPPTVGSAPVIASSTGDQRPAPITYVLPYVYAFVRSVFGFIARLPILIYRLVHTTIFRPLSYPLALILAVLRPVTLLLEIIYDVFLRIPIAVVSWFVREAIYPLYVFTGIAAILGLTFGYSASHIPRAGVFIVELIRSRMADSRASNAPSIVVHPPSRNSSGSYQAGQYGGSFRKRPSLGGPSRSVTFEDSEDGRYY